MNTEILNMSVAAAALIIGLICLYFAHHVKAAHAQPTDPMEQLFELYVHFKARGWRDMTECPKNRSVEFMEFGSTGIHEGVQDADGNIWVGPEGWPSYPIMWREIKEKS